MPAMRRIHLLAAFLLSCLSLPAWAIDVDGVVDPGEWQGAKHITDSMSPSR